MSNEYKEDVTAFYIPESVIARVASRAFLKFKMEGAVASSASEGYKHLLDVIYEKTGLQVMLIHCYSYMTDAIGNKIEVELDYTKCSDDKLRIWGSPSFDVKALMKLAQAYGNDKGVQELGLFPIRWTPKTLRGE